jgi:hypothetical protein
MLGTAAGCGADNTGDKKQDSQRAVKVRLKTVPLSKAQYVAKADRFCDQAWAFMLTSFSQRYPVVAHGYQNEEDAKAEGTQFHEASQNIFLAGMQALFDNLQYVGAPETEEHEIDRVLRALQRAIYDGWERRITSAKQFSEIFNRFTVLAYEYGINHCLTYESNFRETALKRKEA